MKNQLSKNGATFIRLHEGFRAKWYADPVGIGTIGIGFTWRSVSFREWWSKNKPGVKFGPGASMTREEADDALMFLVNNEYGKAVDNFLGKKVEQHVFDGSVSPVFNLGPGSLKWKWATAVKRGDLKEAGRLLTSTGVTAKGRKLAGLVRRRKEEALLITDGIYTGVTPGTVQKIIPDAMADGVLERGEAGPSVAKLIRDLHALEFYDGILDDVFGHGTEAAVLEFQRDHVGLTVNGVAGPETLKAITRAISLKRSASVIESVTPSVVEKSSNGPKAVAVVVTGAGALIVAFWNEIKSLFEGMF
jgi:lysozyme